MTLVRLKSGILWANSFCPEHVNNPLHSWLLFFRTLKCRQENRVNWLKTQVGIEPQHLCEPTNLMCPKLLQCPLYRRFADVWLNCCFSTKNRYWSFGKIIVTTVTKWLAYSYHTTIIFYMDLKYTSKNRTWHHGIFCYLWLCFVCFPP